MNKKQDKKPKKQKDDDLPVVSLDSCESFDPSSEKIESDDENSSDFEPDFDID